MTERKMRKLVTAGTALAVVVLFFLIIVLVWQMAALSSKKREVERKHAECEELLERNKDRADWIRFMTSEEGKLWLAHRYGYKETQ